VVAQSHSRAAETELGADAATLAGGGVRLSGCLKSGGGGRSAAREGADDECAPWMWCDRTESYASATTPATMPKEAVSAFRLNA